MKLELSSDDARALDLGHRWALISRLEIIEIADSLIERNDILPSAQICELATCLHDDQIKTLLSNFFDSSDKWTPVTILLAKYIELSELTSLESLRLYYGISGYADWDDPDPWRKIKILCHELDDARAGVYGDGVEAFKEIAEEIHTVLISAIQN